MLQPILEFYTGLNYNYRIIMQREKIEEKIQEEIRRRAFARADFLKQEKASHIDTGFTLDALQKVTGLPRSELKQIADDVRASFKRQRKDYFSVKYQFIIVLGSLAVLVFLIYGLIHWVF